MEEMVAAAADDDDDDDDDVDDIGTYSSDGEPLRLKDASTAVLVKFQSDDVDPSAAAPASDDKKPARSRSKKAAKPKAKKANI